MFMCTLIKTSMILSYVASYLYMHKVIDQTSILDPFFFIRNFGNLLQSAVVANSWSAAFNITDVLYYADKDAIQGIYFRL